MSSSTTVFVSGASGFVAQTLVKQLIEKDYKVVGTVRSNEKGDSLKENLKAAKLASENFTYEIVKDISVKGAFDDALKKHPEVTVFLHTASPFHFNITDIEKELLTPAVEGTNNALQAIKTYGPQVKRVVVTSSYAAIGRFGDLADPSIPANEESWNPITWEQSLADPLSGYVASKKFAEKAAWDFVEKEKPNFTLSVINPVYIFGPQAFEIKNKSQLNTSSEIINGLLNSKPNDTFTNLTGYFIDVRDVAKAHIVAFEKDSIQGKRLILAESPFTTQSILDLIHKDFPQLNSKLPKGDPSQADAWKKGESRIDNEKTRELLGFKFIDFKKSIDDSVVQIIG
ncbi:D-lactaldehyde dehydrogenase, putative [Candida dubliniensis CD36]|uniref:NADPH-dependent methylglyoxal reductase, putative n=1 Tax=Candida dubliniensis (strain CD36 / ATCC MYA-646 / CBS 7987 / NCPF 3949 / NRRL Y-17841) TaxID=573826 RepID=B9WHK4_CANDC|nr:D-lactaldehyde dehydrogenase, putative [Candida dubliniensis CD36]CAX41646.1 D-lactaldehyde dehydrogenase, putative [Candida dubliniensis CD36]